MLQLADLVVRVGGYGVDAAEAVAGVELQLLDAGLGVCGLGVDGVGLVGQEGEEGLDLGVEWLVSRALVWG